MLVKKGSLEDLVPLYEEPKTEECDTSAGRLGLFHSLINSKGKRDENFYTASRVQNWE